MLPLRNDASCSSVIPNASCPSKKTPPAVGGSSVPITCRNVLFPTPLGPTSDAISPAPSAKLAPRSTWISFSPSQYDLCTPRASSRAANSFLPEAVDRREAARLRRRIERREIAQRQRDGGDHRELRSVDVHGQVRDVIDVGIELQAEFLDERAGSEAEQQPDRGPDRADGEAL